MELKERARLLKIELGENFQDFKFSVKTDGRSTIYISIMEGFLNFENEKITDINSYRGNISGLDSEDEIIDMISNYNLYGGVSLYSIFFNEEVRQLINDIILLATREQTTEIDYGSDYPLHSNYMVGNISLGTESKDYILKRLY